MPSVGESKARLIAGAAPAERAVAVPLSVGSGIVGVVALPFRSTSGIANLLEGFDAAALDKINKHFRGLAFGQIEIDDPSNQGQNLVVGHRRAQSLPQYSAVLVPSANSQLVPGLAFFLHTENSNVADVMVSAGIHAAGYLYFHGAYRLLLIQIGEGFMECFGQGQGRRVGDAAEVQPGTGDAV